MSEELTELEQLLLYLETTSLEPHDDYTSEFTYKDQKILWEYIKELQRKNEILEYIKSGEYLNQLKYERNLLENIVKNMKVSKEDKEFIDMTHRNTELLEENTQLKSVLKEIREYIDSTLDGQYALEPDYAPDFTLVNTLEKIDDMLGKGLNRNEQR